jgi:hypothetical protein
LAALGLLVLATATLFAGQSPLARWTLSETLAPARVLPLFGLGAAFALIGARALMAALLLFAFGIATGLLAEDRLLWALDTVPGAATHLFLTTPIAYLAAGAALVASARWREWLTPVGAAIFGAMLGLTIKLTDPSLHEPAYTVAPVLIAFWILGAVALTLRAFRRGWFAIFGRILGSWLIAIGLLYGGASLIPKRQPPPPAVALPPASAPAPGAERAIPGLPVPDQPAPFPGGIDRFRQP